MPEEACVRIPLRSRPQGAGPAIDERMLLRLPRVATLVRRLVFGLPPPSRIRRALLARSVAIAFCSYERGDYVSPVRLFYSPEVEVEFGTSLQQHAMIDLPRAVSGSDAVIRWLKSWHEPFTNVRWELREMFDYGPRGLVYTLDQLGEGRASGIPVNQKFASAVRISDGRIVWQKATWDAREAFASLGLEPPRQRAPRLEDSIA